MADRIRKIVLVVLGMMWLTPIYLIVINAAKTQKQYASTSVWKPAGIEGLFGNVAVAWTRGDIAEAVWSSTLYAITAPVIAVIIGAAAGFAIVALNLRHGFGWFVFIFSSTVVPLQILLLPLFVGYVSFDLYDTRAGMILVYVAISIPFSAFVMRNFFAGIAHSVFEAAVVDGANSWRIFWRIYLPMSGPALVAVFILQATLIWNDLLLGMTLSKSAEVRPLMGSLAALQGNYGGSTAPVLLAGGLLVSIPTVVLFMASQRAFSRGLALGQY